ncbi:MAG: hypothetical protein RML40_05830 [Bacteroidota bacterium]|nr:hypothetical protein [Candidatus Kapabacteria bacterium]MDW8220033.1 hypothetical protein [Bacteroidota bacterium]
MRTFLATYTLFLALGSTYTCAQSDEKLMKAKELAQKAAIAGDVTKLNIALEHAEEAAKQSSHRANALYYCGFIRYHLCMLPSEKDARERHTDEGIAALEEAISLEPNFADAHALLGSLYGVKAGLGMINGIKYGSKSTSSMERALALVPNNPRVLILHGISLYYTPAMWGGNKEKALMVLQKACELAEQGACIPEKPFSPDWGHAEAFAWKGAIFAGMGDSEYAKAAYERALQIAPDYAWVKHILVPKLGAK